MLLYARSIFFLELDTYTFAIKKTRSQSEVSVSRSIHLLLVTFQKIAPKSDLSKEIILFYNRKTMEIIGNSRLGHDFAKSKRKEVN